MSQAARPALKTITTGKRFVYGFDLAQSDSNLNPAKSAGRERSITVRLISPSPPRPSVLEKGLSSFGRNRIQFSGLIGQLELR
jgi:hypothetical protein